MTRILAAAGCVLAAAVIAVFLLIVPPMLQDYQSGTGDAGGSDRHAADGAGDTDGYSERCLMKTVWFGRAARR